MALKTPTPHPPSCNNIQKERLRKSRLTLPAKEEEEEEESDEAEGGVGGKEEHTEKEAKTAKAADGTEEYMSSSEISEGVVTV